MTKRKRSQAKFNFSSKHLPNYQRANKLRGEVIEAIFKQQSKILELLFIIRKAEFQQKQSVHRLLDLSFDQFESNLAILERSLDRFLDPERLERKTILSSESKQGESESDDDETVIVRTPKSKFLFKKHYSREEVKQNIDKKKIKLHKQITI